MTVKMSHCILLPELCSLQVDFAVGLGLELIGLLLLLVEVLHPFGFFAQAEFYLLLLRVGALPLKIYHNSAPAGAKSH